MSQAIRKKVGSKVSSGDQVNVACIGIGTMGTSNMFAAETAGARIAAICEVDKTKLETAGGNFPDAKLYTDYRRLLEKEKGLDGVIVSTPNHTHAVIATAAMELGKHVYCEKPLAHTLREIRLMTQAEQRYGVATQLGNQGHSFRTTREIYDCIHSGAIGAVREVHLVEGLFSYSLVDRMEILEEDHAVPDNLDWELWLGPAQYRKYNPLFHPSRWRCVRQFSTGMIGDFFCHLADPIYFALDLQAPTSIVADTKGYEPEVHAETFSKSSRIKFEFPAQGDRPAVTMFWYDGDHFFPPRPEELKEDDEFIPILGPGTCGALVVGDNGKMLYGSHGGAEWRLIPDTRMNEYMAGRARVTDPRWTKMFARSVNNLEHHIDWLAACRGEKSAGANFGYGGPLTEIAVLGDIAQQMPGTELNWDASNMTFSNSQADERLHYQYRDGWSLSV